MNAIRKHSLESSTYYLHICEKLSFVCNLKKKKILSNQNSVISDKLYLFSEQWDESERLIVLYNYDIFVFILRYSRYCFVSYIERDFAFHIFCKIFWMMKMSMKNSLFFLIYLLW